MENNNNAAIEVFDATALQQGQELIYQTINKEQTKLSIKIAGWLASTGNGVQINEIEALSFIRTCKIYGFDPFLKQVYLIKYDASKPANIVIAADTFIRVADSHPNYLGYETGWIVTDSTGKLRKCCTHGEGIPDNTKIIGAWCHVIRKGRTTPVVEVLTSEMSTGRATWKTLPQTMTTKCATAQAHRKAFPDLLGGLYSADERPDLAINGNDYEPENMPDTKKRDERTDDEPDTRTLEDVIYALGEIFTAKIKEALPRIYKEKINPALLETMAFTFGGAADDYLELPGKWTIANCDHMMSTLEADGIPVPILEMFAVKPEPEHPEPIDEKTAQKEHEAAGAEFELNGGK